MKVRFGCGGNFSSKGFVTKLLSLRCSRASEFRTAFFRNVFMYFAVSASGKPQLQ